MVAAPAFVDQTDQDYALKGIEGELERLGKWAERNEEYKGYPTVNILYASMSGCGGSIPGHIVLCLDMPAHIYSIWGRVLRLSVEEREVICAHYNFRVHEHTIPRPQYYVRGGVTEGKWIPLGISERTYWRRLKEAKLRLLGLGVVNEF